MVLLGTSSNRALIIGGGIIGLSIGWQLARKKISVMILEKETAGRQASWMAAGMLAPFSEAGFEDGEKLALGQEALSLYPRFLQELEEDSGVRIELEGNGTLFVTLNRSDRQWLQWIYSFKEKQGLPLQWLNEEEIRSKEPLLSSRVGDGIWLPTERQIHHRNLLDALRKAFISQGGILKEGAEVAELLHSNNRFRGVKLAAGEEIEAERGILAAGAWSTLFPFLECKEIRPVKGQILLAHDQGQFRLSHMIRTPRVYLAQKSDGTIRIGATSEEKGFDRTSTCGAVLQLLQSAWEVLPAIEEFSFDAAEAAFRPVSKSDFPIVGASSIEGLHFAMGHGRGGILLAPYTAFQMTDGGFLYGNQSERPSRDSSLSADIGGFLAQPAHY